MVTWRVIVANNNYYNNYCCYTYDVNISYIHAEIDKLLLYCMQQK